MNSLLVDKPRSTWDKRRISFSYRIVLLAFIAGIVLSWKLWTSDRLFPMAPFNDSVSILSVSINYVLFGGLLSLLMICFFFRSRILLAGLLILLLFLLLQDQNRWQPWVYMYALILLPFILSKRLAAEFILNYSRVVIIGIYFWSGIHKLDSAFLSNTFKLMLTDLLGIEDPELIGKLFPLGYCIGSVEIAVALLLWFSKTRSIGVMLALVSHLFILLYLSPIGIDANTVVYPWNVAMFLLVIFLFYKTKDVINFHINGKLQAALFFPVLVAWVLPLLNLFGWWDNYLSFSLYSDKESKFYIAIDERSTDKIEPALQQYFIQVPGMTGGRLIDATDWSLREMKSPMYPERRVFNRVAGTFCKYGIGDGELYFVEVKSDGSFERFGCRDLN